MNKLILGNQSILFKDIPDNSIDAVVTDPPYGVLGDHKIEKPFDEELFFAECKRVLKPDGKLIFFASFEPMLRWCNIAKKHFNSVTPMIWSKPNPSNPMINPAPRHEYITLYKNKGSCNKIKTIDDKEKSDANKKVYYSYYKKLLKQLADNPDNVNDVVNGFKFGEGIPVDTKDNDNIIKKRKGKTGLGHAQYSSPTTHLEYENVLLYKNEGSCNKIKTIDDKELSDVSKSRYYSYYKTLLQQLADNPNNANDIVNKFKFGNIVNKNKTNSDTVVTQAEKSFTLNNYSSPTTHLEYENVLLYKNSGSCNKIKTIDDKELSDANKNTYFSYYKKLLQQLSDNPDNVNDVINQFKFGRARTMNTKRNDTVVGVAESATFDTSQYSSPTTHLEYSNVLLYKNEGSCNKIKVVDDKEKSDVNKSRYYSYYKKLLQQLADNPDSVNDVVNGFKFGKVRCVETKRNDTVVGVTKGAALDTSQYSSPTTHAEYNNEHVLSYHPHNKQGFNKAKYNVMHPTVKPINLMQHLIGLVAKPGDTILDPFCGSGSTLIAAKVLGVNYIGFELHEQYYNIAKERLKTAKDDYKKNILYEHEYKEQIDKMIKEFKEKQNVKDNQLDIFNNE